MVCNGSNGVLVCDRPIHESGAMSLGKTASVGGLIAFGTITSLFAKIGEAQCPGDLLVPLFVGFRSPASRYVFTCQSSLPPRSL